MILDEICYSAIHFGRITRYVWGSPPVVSLFTDVYLGWNLRFCVSLHAKLLLIVIYII